MNEGRFNKSVNHIFINLTKIVCTGVSIAFLVFTINWKVFIILLKNMHAGNMLLTCVMIWLVQFFSIIRLHYILNIFAKKISMMRLIRIHYIGFWFNQVLPTSLGGDVVKISMLKNDVELGFAVKSVFLDRCSGLLFLFLAITLTLPLYSRLFKNSPKLFTSISLLAGLGIAGMLLMFVLISIPKNFVPSVIRRIVFLFSDMRDFFKIKSLWQQFWSSGLIHCSGIIIYYLLAQSLYLAADFYAFVLVVPLIFFVALLPISFAGWGIRELGSVYLFNFIGISKEHALAISVGYGVLLILASLPGLLMSFDLINIRHGLKVET